MEVPQQIRDDFALYVDAFVAMGQARIGPDRSAAARLAGAIQGDTGE